MGTCWEIVDKRNRRCFDLDKGNWALAKLDRGGQLSLNDVRAGIAAAFAHYCPGRLIGNPEYAEATTKAIWAFCEEAGWDIIVVSDVGDYPDDEMVTWPVVAGRFASW